MHLLSCLQSAKNEEKKKKKSLPLALTQPSPHKLVEHARELSTGGRGQSRCGETVDLCRGAGRQQTEPAINGPLTTGRFVILQNTQMASPPLHGTQTAVSWVKLLCCFFPPYSTSPPALALSV